MPKRSIRISGHPTSLSLEEPFWQALRDIAAARGLAISTVVTEIDTARAADDPEGSPDGSLSSALRVYILRWYQHGPH